MRTRQACDVTHVEIRNPRNCVSTLSKYELITQSIPFILKLSKMPRVALPVAWQHPGTVLDRAKVRMVELPFSTAKGIEGWPGFRFDSRPSKKELGMVKDGHVPAETCAGKSLASIRTMSRPWQKH